MENEEREDEYRGYENYSKISIATYDLAF